MKSGALFSVVGLLAVAGLLWFLLGNPETPSFDETHSLDDGRAVEAHDDPLATTPDAVSERIVTTAGSPIHGAGTLRVRVVNESGEPIAGANATYAVDEIRWTVLTAADGIAAFDGLPLGVGTLVVSAQGHRAARDDRVTVLRKDERDWRSAKKIVLSAAPWTTGTVEDAATGRPITDAQVRIAYPSLLGMKSHDSVRTDDQGAFRILVHGGERDPMQFRVQKGGYAEARPVRSALDTSTLVIKLYRPLAAFRGVVYDANSLPAQSATVTFGNVDGLMPGEQTPSTTTDDTGGFSLAPPPWTTRRAGYQVIAISHKGEIGQTYVRAPTDNQTLAEPLTQTVAIRLAGSGILEGVVRRDDGAPVEGAVVALEPDWSQRADGALSMQVFQTLRDRQLLPTSTVTDSQGRYRFLHVPAMSYRINATHGAEFGSSEDAMAVAPGGVAEMNITIGTGRRIKGWVHDDRGDPIPGAQVRAMPQDLRPGRSGRPTTTRARSDGTFTLLGVGNGPFVLNASLPGFATATVNDVEAGQADVELILPQHGRIIGQVLQDGRGFQGTFTAQAQRATTTHERTFHSEDGTFELAGVEPGTYIIRVATKDGSVGLSDSIEVTDGADTDDIRIALTPGASLYGTVSERSGAPIVNAIVTANANHASVRTGSDGGYRITGLAPGPYSVRVRTNGRQWHQYVTLDAGSDERLDLVYQVSGTIEIVVVDTHDTPLKGARPDIRSESGVPLHANLRATQSNGLVANPQDRGARRQTDEKGRLIRHHVPPGRYQITANLSGYATSSATWVVVTSGATAQARVVMQAANSDNR